MKKVLFLLSIFIITLYAERDLTIDEQIMLIQKAPESERVELMNHFKRQLILMNQTQREVAINRLKHTQTNTTPIESILPEQRNTIIQNLQESSIEQFTQEQRSTNIVQHLQEYTTPTGNTPNIQIPTSSTEHINIPTPVNNPEVQQPTVHEQIPTTPSSIPTPTVAPTNIPTPIDTPEIQQPVISTPTEPTSIPTSPQPAIVTPQPVTTPTVEQPNVPTNIVSPEPQPESVPSTPPTVEQSTPQQPAAPAPSTQAQQTNTVTTGGRF